MQCSKTAQNVMNQNKKDRAEEKLIKHKRKYVYNKS